MKKEEYEKIMYEQDHRYLVKKQLPNHDELLNAFRMLMPITGKINVLFCNVFFNESGELLKQAMGMMLIMNIALDPFSLAFSDPEVDSHIPFDFMTEPIPLYIFEQYLSLDIIEKIKTTNHYTTIKEFFLEKDKLNEATYAVLRESHFDVYLRGNDNSNCHWKGMFISVFKVFDSYLIIQHNEAFTDNELSLIHHIVEVVDQ